MNTPLTNIFNEDNFARILFLIWNEPKTVYNISKNILEKRIEHVIIKCDKCKQKNVFPLNNELKKAYYTDVNLKEIEGIQRFRKFIKKSQRCKHKLSNGKLCRRHLLKYKQKKENKKYILKKPENIEYDYYFYSNLTAIKSKCSNLKKNQLKTLEKEGIITIDKNNDSLCSINWDIFCDLILNELVFRIDKFLRDYETNHARLIKSKESSFDLEKYREDSLKDTSASLKSTEQMIKNLNKNYFNKLIKKFYNPSLEYKNINEFIGWFILSLGQWKYDDFVSKFIEESKFHPNINEEYIKKIVKENKGLFELQKMCYDYKWKKEHNYFYFMDCKVFESLFDLKKFP